MSDTLHDPDVVLRPLQPDDLARMVAIDQAHMGRARRRFLQKRLEMAQAHPEDFLHVGLSRGGKLVGFAFVRLLRGEFGREQVTASLDLVGVDSESRERGYGHRLLDALIRMLREKDVRLLYSQSDWTNHDMLKFFDSLGFKLAPRLALDRMVATPLVESVEE